MLAFKLFGLGFDGSGGTKEEGGITTTPAGYWRDDSILLGFFGFRSHDGPGGKINDRFGVDLRGNYKDFSIAGGFIRGEDHLNDIDQNIGFGELEYWVFPWWVAYTRYEDLVVTNVDEQDVQRFIVGSSFLVVANLKINIEGRFHLTNEPAIHINDETINDDRLTLRIDWAF